MAASSPKISELSGLQKAAILLITLGPDKSANVFKFLKEEEIEELRAGQKITEEEFDKALQKQQGSLWII